MMCDSVMHPFPLMILSLDVRRSWLTKAWKMKMVLVKKARMRSTKSYQILKMCSNSMETAPGACFFLHKQILHFEWSPPWHIILTCFLALYLAYWHSIWHKLYSDIFWYILPDWHSIWHIFWHSIWHLFWHSIYDILPRSWDPAVPTEFWSSRLRSGSAHWDLQLAVEAEAERGGIGGPALIKPRPRDPHLAGGINWQRVLAWWYDVP